MHAASAPARFLQRLQSWRLLRPDARQIINLSLAVLSLLVIVLAARTSWRSLGEYEQARQVAQVDATTNDFITAAGYLQLERTYGSVLLGDERSGASRLGQLRDAQRQGDRVWRRAMDRARAIAARSAMRVDLLARLASAEASFQMLSARRGQLEGCLRSPPCALADDDWQESVSRVIRDSAAAREAVYFSVDTPQRPARLYAAVQRTVWTLNEHVRRERGLMAFYSSANEPLPASARAE
ncbi:MAG TPA: hypothetical protein VF745_12695, partial [Steroidobacteraceae bacterium]